jgi:hypothetical protein
MEHLVKNPIYSVIWNTELWSVVIIFMKLQKNFKKSETVLFEDHES